MTIDTRRLRFTKPVGVRSGVNITAIHTVEDAIVWIGHQTDQNIIKATRVAEGKLRKAKYDETDSLADARQAFVTGLGSVDLLYR